MFACGHSVDPSHGPVPTDQVPSGQWIYLQLCRQCHLRAVAVANALIRRRVKRRVTELRRRQAFIFDHMEYAMSVRLVSTADNYARRFLRIVEKIWDAQDEAKELGERLWDSWKSDWGEMTSEEQGRVGEWVRTDNFHF